MKDKKQELLYAVIAHLLQNGLSELSLRPLADDVGTSARLLIYHFGSKEGLLTEVLDAMQLHLRDSFAGLAEKPTSSDTPLLERVWQWALHERNFPYLKLLYELQILAIQNPATYAQYLQRNALDWQKHIERALPATPHRAALATLCGAVFDGLFLEVLQTGDRARATKALREFLRIARVAYSTADMT